MTEASFNSNYFNILNKMLGIRLSRLFLGGLAFCLLCLLFVSLPTNYTEQCDCGDTITKEQRLLQNYGMKDKTHFKNDKHNIAILVPFRDRFNELLTFAPFISKYLNKQEKNHHIFLINQVDSLRFNRAALLNAGFLETRNHFDHMVLHDVDLLPLNQKIRYPYPNDGIFHVSGPHLHPRYHYPSFIGGILIVKREDFQKVNGMSNNYWGWGLEDDEFYSRLNEANIKISRQENITSGTKNSFRHIHDRKIRKRDMIKCYNQQTITRKRDRLTGLSTVQYKIESKQLLQIDDASITVLNVALACDKEKTPWCDCTSNVGNTPLSAETIRNRDDVIVPKLNRKKHLSPNG